MKKSSKIVLGVVGGIVLVSAIASVGSSSDSSSTATPNDRAAVAKPSRSASPAPVKSQTQAEKFIAFLVKDTTTTEKAAVKHVTKVTGADDFNGILDAPEIYTDFGGDMMSADAGKGKLIASAFAGCYKSDNGLVTVYSKNGDLLSDGNF